MSNKLSQKESGKAFEYAILLSTYKIISINRKVEIKKNNSYQIALESYNKFDKKEQDMYIKASDSAIYHILDLEPRLKFSKNNNDYLELQILSDSEGIKGDVRDILLIRSKQNWEIGISAKNNHQAVKHSRLSDNINFGKEWLNLNSSNIYFKKITPIFFELRKLKEKKELWRNIKEKHKNYYIPILNAFIEELKRIDIENKTIVPMQLLKYLLGNHDFYKAIKRNNKTEIYGFNLNGTLNKPSDIEKPKFKVQKLHLPSRIIEISFKPNSTDTVILVCDEGWQVSFRIHNASSKVEPSLKFDINLIGQPQSLYTNHLFW